MVTVLVVVAMAISFALGAYVATKTLQLGLKYQMQIEKGVEPELNPIEQIVKRQEQKKVENNTDEMISEIWGSMNG